VKQKSRLKNDFFTQEATENQLNLDKNRLFLQINRLFLPSLYIMHTQNAFSRAASIPMMPSINWSSEGKSPERQHKAPEQLFPARAAKFINLGGLIRGAQ
jgi:hypothetical protein